MAVQNVNGSSSYEPQRQLNTVSSKEEKIYCVFDRDGNGTVSTEEQKQAFIDSAMQEDVLIKTCKDFKINLSDFFKNCAAFFTNVTTDGTEKSAQNAKEEIENRILAVKTKLADEAIAKMKGEAKEPPSINTDEGLASEECIGYLIGKIVYMGLEMDAEVFADVLARYDYDLSGDDSVISPKELYNESYTSKFMEHDFEGNIKDTHALDYIANVYAEALKNKE